MASAIPGFAADPPPTPPDPIVGSSGSVTTSKYWPTNKWWVATVTAIGTEATAVLVTGWHRPTQVALVGLVVQRIASWLTPNTSA